MNQEAFDEEMRKLKISILEKILKKGEEIDIISYHHPQRQLGKTGSDYDKTLQVLRALEKEGVLVLNPSHKFPGWFEGRCGYMVKKDRAEAEFKALKQ